ncbi:MAG: DNRLRE domain-containing protein [Ignavibacteriae bacterium]|nr:MAG: DNRLRE domain-containing protein [Ignavibacteriota bacterium]
MKLITHNTGYKYIYFVFTTLFIVLLSLFTQGCADEPTSLGIQFVPPSETTGVKVFDSYVDSIDVTYSSVKRFINTSNSFDLIVGQSGTYNSKGLIKFNGISSDYDSATVTSAVLKLRYRNYYYPVTFEDSLGQIGFDVYTVSQNISYSAVTLDSINTNSFGNIPQGTYTGSPTADSQEINIDLSTSLVKDWLEYAADTNYSAKNYGIVLSPNSSSNVLKGFYSGKVETDLKPSLQIIVTKNNDTDTLVLNTTETVFLANGDIPIVPGVFFLQGGINYIELFKFVTNAVPSTATINDAQLILTIDQDNSLISPQTQRKVIGLSAIDSGALNTEGEFSALELNGKYSMRMIYPFQKWIQGGANYGLLVVPSNRFLNLDLFAFHNIDSPDPNKRPRIIIRYSPRVIP